MRDKIVYYLKIAILKFYMKKVFIIALLILTTSAFCDLRGKRYDSDLGELVYFSGGYSQTLNGTTPVGDLSVGMSFFPFDNCWLQLGIDFLHFQIAPTDRFQTVSDESLLQFSAILFTFPLSLSYSKDGNSIKLNEWYFYYFIPSIFFLMHGSLYFPFLSNDWFGIINKHRFVTEVITKGFHKKSFTFQDDLGLRVNIYTGEISRITVEGGIRFEKNFSRDLVKKWFVQAGYMSF